MGHKARKPARPARPPIPAFVIEAAKAEGVAPEVVEERMIEDLAQLLRAPATE